VLAGVVFSRPPIVFFSGDSNRSHLWNDRSKEELYVTHTARPNPIPTRYRRVTPALVVDGGVRALEFYAEVFGAVERLRTPGPGGTIVHAEIEIGDSVLIVEDPSPWTGTKAPPVSGLEGSPTFLYVYVEDVDAVIERAVKLGATLKRPPRDQFYGDRDGFIVDPFGHAWTIASHVEDVSPDEMMRRMAAFQGASAPGDGAANR
jgi:PhnB protein